MFKEDVDFVASGGNTTTVRSLETFRDWLRHEIAKSSDAGFTGVDFSRSLADLGFSSVHTVRLAGELENLLEIDIEPTLLAEFESIDAMCVTLFRMREGMRNRDTNAPYVQTVRVAASFTAELIEPTVCNLLGRLGMPANVQFAGYNQVFQALLNPEGVFAGEGGINVVVMRVEDLFRHHNTPPAGRNSSVPSRSFATHCSAMLTEVVRRLWSLWRRTLPTRYAHSVWQSCWRIWTNASSPLLAPTPVSSPWTCAEFTRTGRLCASGMRPVTALVTCPSLRGVSVPSGPVSPGASLPCSANRQR
ncbi:acyl carrier protein [Mycobacterium ulcerans]